MKVYYVRHDDGRETRLPLGLQTVSEASAEVAEQWANCGVKILLIREYEKVSEKLVQVNTHYWSY